MSQLLHITNRRWWNCPIYRNTYMEAEENLPLLDISLQRRNYDQTIRNTIHTICLIFLGTVVMLGVSIGSYLLLNDDRAIVPDNLIMVTRTFWDVQLPIKNVRNLTHPIENIFLTPTYTQTCVDKSGCIADLQEIQRRQRKILGEEEITYNFFAGGDGRIYEARGWSNTTSKRYFDREVLLIALSGNFIEYTPQSETQVKSVVNLLDYGIATNKLNPCFQVMYENSNTTHLAAVIFQIENKMSSRILC